jgi:hypothetical protein
MPIRAYPELAAWEGNRGYAAAPGRYQARLSVAGKSQTQAFEVLPDPRSTTSSAQNAEKQALLAALKGETIALLDAVQEMKAARAALQAKLADSGSGGNARARRSARALDARLDKWLDLTVEANDRHFIDPSHSSERLDFNLLSTIAMVDNMDAPITSGLAQRVADVRAEWTKRRAEYLALKGEVSVLALAGPEADSASRM